MRQAQQRPLPFYFLFSAEQELTEPARLLDLPEHRLHYALARRVDGFAHLGLQFPFHPFHPGRALRQRTALRRQAMLAMLLLACRDEPLDLTLRFLGRLQVLQVLLRTISVVGQNRFRTLSLLLFDEFHHGLQLLFIIGCFRHRLPDDQQKSRLQRRLRIVALHYTVSSFHYARLRVVEVVLILSSGVSRFRSSSGNSSPRWLPYWRSSASP